MSNLIRSSQVDRDFMGLEKYISFVVIEHCIKLVVFMLQFIVHMMEFVFRRNWSIWRWSYISIYPRLLVFLYWTWRIATKSIRESYFINCLVLKEILWEESLMIIQDVFHHSTRTIECECDEICVFYSTKFKSWYGAN